MSQDPWSRILGRASEKDCTDPRDKVYGILGLLHGKTVEIQPDEKASVAEIYKRAMLQHSNADIGSDGMFVSHNGWSASGFSSSSWSQPDDNTLCIEGVRLGTVTAISPLLWSEEGFVDFVRAVVDGPTDNLSTPKYKVDHFQHFVYLFNNGYIREFHPGEKYMPTWTECIDRMWDHVEFVGGAVFPERSPVKSHASMMPPPRLFYTSDDRIGSGSADT
ncbi:hypothetical protein OQA88_8020 [Cercophora sp. LCS_1]